MRWWMLGALALSACVAETVPEAMFDDELGAFPAEFDLPVDGQVPPPMTLVAGPLVPGTPFLLTAFGANPGDEVWFVRSPTLGTTCAPYLADCLGISQPVVMSSVIADATGVASLLINVPRSIPVGVTQHFQAGVLGGQNGYISNLVTGMSENVCGDGIEQSNEECDDGNNNNTDGCTNNCIAGSCGDGVVGANEACDDGNIIQGDGCSNSCELDRFSITIRSATIAPSPPNSFDPWDVVALPFFEDPDVFIDIYVGNTLQGTTVVEDDTLTPSWFATTTLSVAPGQVMTLQVFDEDTFLSTFIDDVVITYADLVAADGSGVVFFDGADGLVTNLSLTVSATSL